MIYIIESGNYFKVGFTKSPESWSNRIESYNTHNPDWTILKTIEGGSRKLETYLHLKLKDYLHRGEWFNKFDGWLDTVIKYTELFKVEPKVEKVKRASFTEVVNYFRVHNKGGKVDDWGYCSAMTDYINIVNRYYQITNSTNTHYSQSVALVSLYDKIEVDELKVKLMRSFRIDEEYESSELKKKLQSIYDKFGLQKEAKVRDIYTLYPNTTKRKSNGKRYYKIQK